MLVGHTAEVTAVHWCPTQIDKVRNAMYVCCLLPSNQQHVPLILPSQGHATTIYLYNTSMNGHCDGDIHEACMLLSHVRL